MKFFFFVPLPDALVVILPLFSSIRNRSVRVLLPARPGVPTTGLGYAQRDLFFFLSFSLSLFLSCLFSLLIFWEEKTVDVLRLLFCGRNGRRAVRMMLPHMLLWLVYLFIKEKERERENFFFLILPCIALLPVRVHSSRDVHDAVDRFVNRFFFLSLSFLFRFFRKTRRCGGGEGCRRHSRVTVCTQRIYRSCAVLLCVGLFLIHVQSKQRERALT